MHFSAVVYDRYGNEKATSTTGPSSISKPPEWWQQAGTSVLECWYPSMCMMAVAFGTGAPAINTLIAMPFMSPCGGVLDNFGFNCTAAGGATSKARAGIYANKSDTDLFPTTRLFDSGEFDCSTGHTGTKTANPSLTIQPGVLYWFAYLCGTAAPTIRTLSLSNCYPIFGISTAIGSAPGIGVTVAQTYGALPDPFTTTAAAVLTAVPIPGLFAHFSS